MVLKTQEDFLEACKNAVVVWFNEHTYELESGNGSTVFIAHDDVNVVWAVKCLQNRKAIMSVICQPWGTPNILFELSYNGSKNELYMDVYQKLDNKAFVIKEEQ